MSKSYWLVNFAVTLTVVDCVVKSLQHLQTFKTCKPC